MRQHRTVLLVPCVDVAGNTFLISGPVSAPVLTPFMVPTSTALNTWLAITTANAAGASIGGNISGAILDNIKLGLASSTTDNTLTITNVGNEQYPTLTKVDATLEVFADLDPLGNGVFNLAAQLLRAPDLRYVAVDRIQGNKLSTTTFAAGDVISEYVLKTDIGIDNVADGKFVTMSQKFIPSGVVLPNYTLLS
jgi:hypothetical protein